MIAPHESSMHCSSEFMSVFIGSMFFQIIHDVSEWDTICDWIFDLTISRKETLSFIIVMYTLNSVGSSQSNSNEIGGVIY